MSRAKLAPQRSTRRVQRRREPGRPAGDADVRNTLLTAASRLFLRHGFDKVTARQIAAAADTTPAMIHYYFTSKLGLFRAMLQEAIEPFQRQLAAALSTENRAPDLPVLIAAHMRTAAAHPWIPVLIVHEVLAEGGRFRATFIRDVAGPMLSMLVQVIERGRVSGQLRPDLDARLAALSLVSLCVFPFLARPVVTGAMELQLEGEQLERLIEHNARLCLDSWRNPAAEKSA
ncbi:MAG TPA: TetR/AcrR family transcriptional regulator [Povalibacter sp.]|nr:TetR/AcrR family transcriptional regulator [Povalibacter sp.]